MQHCHMINVTQCNPPVDASQAHANGRMDSGIKGVMGSDCNSGFEYPPCDAPAWDKSGRLYTAGNRVSHK